METINFIQMSDDREIPYPTGSNVEKTRNIVKSMAKAFKELYPDPEKQTFSFLVRGSSGSVIAGMLCVLLPDYMIEIIPVRKEDEHSHCGSQRIFLSPRDKIIIVDDFMATGNTIQAIWKTYEDKLEAVDALILSGTVSEKCIGFPVLNVIGGTWDPIKEDLEVN